MRYEQISDGDYDYEYDDGDFNYSDGDFISPDDDFINDNSLAFSDNILFDEDDDFGSDQDEQEDEYSDIYSLYGNCFVGDPYQFIPDGEVCMPDELISWRRALREVKKGTFVPPEHCFWVTGDTIPDGIESAIAFKGGSGQSIIHGHYRTWGMGINSCSDEISNLDFF